MSAPTDRATRPAGLRPGAVRDWFHRTRRTYEEGHERAEGRPLRGYAVLLATYLVLVGTGVVLVRRRTARGGPVDVPSVADVLLLAVATFRLSRTVAKDAVLAPLRAPFATYQGRGGPGEVMEAPRPGPVRHAVGELVTCPFCLAQWVATTGAFGMLLRPRATRWAAGVLAAVAGADALHLGFARLQGGD
ncbi:DUF1360 domain-containing protein [Thalassiella azotivora]